MRAPSSSGAIFFAPTLRGSSPAPNKCPPVGRRPLGPAAGRAPPPAPPAAPGGRRLPSTCATHVSAFTGDKLEPGPFRLGGTRSVSLTTTQTPAAPALCFAAHSALGTRLDL